MYAAARPHCLTIEQALAMGYCIISRRHREAARIDSAEWLGKVVSLYPGSSIKPNAAWASQYRRCHSHDRITVSSQWLKLLPNSDDAKAPKDFQQ